MTNKDSSAEVNRNFDQRSLVFVPVWSTLQTLKPAAYQDILMSALSELPTPCLLLDQSKLDRNLARMAERMIDRKSGVLDQLVPSRDTRHVSHQKEGLSEHRRIGGEPKWFGHRHSGLVRGTEQGELLRPAVACGHARRRIRAQHQRVLAGERPVRQFDL